MISCLHPRNVYNKYLGRYITVPCGHCDACLSIKANEWSNRCELERFGRKYCFFGTLTYSDSTYPRFDVRQLFQMGDTEFDDAFIASEDFLKLWDYNIRVHDYRDFQLFIKHLRNGIYADYKERVPFSYFVVQEYGPTTFHPHYHMLLYFDDSRLFRTIKERVYQAWKFKNPSSPSQFFKRNRWSYVRCSASSYVAGYTNMFQNLPPILQYDLFRPQHSCSKSTSFGSAGIQPNSLQAFQRGDTFTISYARPSSHRVVDVSLWRSIENRFFPRCISYDLLSNECRMEMYKLSIRYGQGKTFDEFVECFMSEWLFIPPLSDDFRSVFKVTSYTAFGNSCYAGIQRPFDVVRLRRAFYLSRRFCELAAYSDYANTFSRIVEYYSRKNYSLLIRQLKWQEDVSKTLNGTSQLPYFPFIIDGLFYENKRHLPLSTFTAYCEQFHLDSILSSKLKLKDACFEYREKRALFHRIVSDNTKTRIKKDYLSLHPEFSLAYRSVISKPLIL